MRFVKVFFLILLFVLSMVFFVQNNAVLSQTMSLQFSLFVESWRSVPIPFYFLILSAFALGGILSLLYFFLDKRRIAGELKKCRSRLASLEQEVNSLRNLPLEDQGLSSYGATASTSATGIGSGLSAPGADNGSDDSDKD